MANYLNYCILFLVLLCALLLVYIRSQSRNLFIQLEYEHAIKHQLNANLIKLQRDQLILNEGFTS